MKRGMAMEFKAGDKIHITSWFGTPVDHTATITRTVGLDFFFAPGVVVPGLKNTPVRLRYNYLKDCEVRQVTEEEETAVQPRPEPTVTRHNIRDLPLAFDCTCGAPVTLWFNGGALDEHTCACGAEYYIRHKDIELVSIPARKTAQ